MTRYATPCQFNYPDELITMGQYNEIATGVQFLGFKGGPPGRVVIGDCNVIHEGVRIMVGPGGFSMGDYNVVHNHVTIGGPGRFTMDHNCWFGQEVWLDSTGDLTLGNGVRIGLRSHVWSHMASGEQLEGWPVVFRETRLDDDVWLVGDDVHVASGVTMGARSAALAHATVTRDTEPDAVYAGTPAKKVDWRLRRDVTLDDKFEMMWRWAQEFDPAARRYIDTIQIDRGGDTIRVVRGKLPARSMVETFFSLTTKTYTKRLTQLERDFLNFLKNNKARFLPV